MEAGGTRSGLNRSIRSSGRVAGRCPSRPGSDPTDPDRSLGPARPVGPDQPLDPILAPAFHCREVSLVVPLHEHQRGPVALRVIAVAQIGRRTSPACRPSGESCRPAGCRPRPPRRRDRPAAPRAHGRRAAARAATPVPASAARRGCRGCPVHRGPGVVALAPSSASASASFTVIDCLRPSRSSDTSADEPGASDDTWLRRSLLLCTGTPLTARITSPRLDAGGRGRAVGLHVVDERAARVLELQAAAPYPRSSAAPSRRACARRTWPSPTQLVHDVLRHVRRNREADADVAARRRQDLRVDADQLAAGVLTSAPPELPWLIGASVCRKSW